MLLQKPDVASGPREGARREEALSCHLKRHGRESGEGGTEELQCKGPEVEKSKVYFRN